MGALVPLPALPRVLVAASSDDLPLIQAMLGERYQVQPAASGTAALALLARETFDLALLDAHTPENEGFAILAQIRASAQLACLPVILIVAAEDVARGLQMGASDCLSRPVNAAAAQARIDACLALRARLVEQERLIDELRGAQRQRENFFAIASHDLKHPLSSIRLAGHLLRENVAGSDSCELLDEIESALDTMQEIVHDYLDTVALQSGALELCIEPVNVEDVLWEAVVQHAVAAQKKSITVQIASAEGQVMADQRRLAQAVGNLLSNALKYAPARTVVTLRGMTIGRQMRISVQDQGPGIPQAERSRLFRQFGKTSVRPTAGESSTGLGLWIVEQLVTLQNGRVGFDCPPGGGSIFWLELPAAPVEAPAARASQPAHSFA